MLSIIELCTPADPLLLPWLDLYETAFPPDQRILVSSILHVLHERQRGRGLDRHLLAAADEEAVADEAAGEPANEKLAGLLFTYQPLDLDAAFLWYLAVDPTRRSQGLGSYLYQQVLRSCHPGVRALVFDLEDPEQMPTPEQKELAGRRIQFYKRQGARLLGGLRYIQRVGDHMPPIQLRLMIHPLVELTPQQGYDLAAQVLGGAMTPVAELFWE